MIPAVPYIEVLQGRKSNKQEQTYSQDAGIFVVQCMNGIDQTAGSFMPSTIHYMQSKDTYDYQGGPNWVRVTVRGLHRVLELECID